MIETITSQELKLVCEEQAETMTMWEIIEVGKRFSESSVRGAAREQLPKLREAITGFLASRQIRLDNCITVLQNKIHSPLALEALDILAHALVQRFGVRDVRNHLTNLIEKI